MTQRDPQCRHRDEIVGRVSSHRDLVAGNDAGEPTASTVVCGRNECVLDAEQWVQEITGIKGQFYGFPVGTQQNLRQETSRHRKPRGRE